MNEADPIELLFGGMDKLGPGSDVETLRVLDLLPRSEFRLAVDAGSGAGRQTLALARRLQTIVHAVDNYEPFLSRLEQRAEAAGIGHLIETHLMDIAEIPGKFPEIDLLWSEGAAYNIGFPNALNTWRPAISPGGFAVVSELCWLSDRPPEEVREFFAAGYPDMKDVEENRLISKDAGYSVLSTHTIPKSDWVEGYYDILGPRAKSLLDHPDEAVREFAAETIEEIRIFEISERSYGYVFFILAGGRT